VTALQIARRLGYVSVEQVLQAVTAVSPSNEFMHPDFKYSMVGPEKMEEHSISDSEEEPGQWKVKGQIICSAKVTGQWEVRAYC